MGLLSNPRLEMIVRRHRWTLLLLATWGLYFVTLGARTVFFDPTGGFAAGHLNVWSDWSLHIGMARIFAEKSPSDWFAYHPMYADGKMTYPFLANFIPGMFMRAGVPLVPAMLIPTVITFVLLLLGIQRLMALLLKSEAKAFLALSIFFLASGLGFVEYFLDVWKSPSWDAVFFPRHEFGRMDSVGWYAVNFITGMFLPQRAFPLGMMVSVWSFFLLFSAMETELPEISRRRRLLLGGVLTGILPICHMHSFIFMFVIAGTYCACRFRRWRELLLYVVPAGILSTKLYLTFIAGGIQNTKFMDWYPGYVAKNPRDWLIFWCRAWGIMLPVAAAGLVRGRRGWSLAARVFFFGSAFFFVASNLVLFQPIPWDNSKILLWCYLGFSACATHVLWELWQRTGPRRRLWRTLAAACFILLTATGWIEIVRLQQISRHSWQMINPDDIALAERVRAATGPRDRFLTESSHNHWVMFWAARPMLLGYTAWVFNYGFNYQQLEMDIREIYKGTPRTLELLRQHRVSYVVIGPGETRLFQPDEAFFEKRFPIAFRNGGYRVYDVRNPSPQRPNQ